MRHTLIKTLAGSMAYLIVALACLIQWKTPNPWLRVDWYAGSYFLLRFASSLHSIFSSLGVFRSKPLREEWWAVNADPAGSRWVMVLMAFDLAVFLDYGHWQLTPWLARSTLQAAGLVLYLTVMPWQIWTDSYLSRFFGQSGQPLAPINEGPYRYVRHPRYASAIAGKVAMALIFASVFGWLLVIAWGLLLMSKIEVEEKHLRKVFGVSYESYARTTAKVVPGIY